MRDEPTVESLNNDHHYGSDSDEEDEWPDLPPATLTRRNPKRKCSECRRQGLECEGEPYPCSNCQENGYGHVCPKDITAAENLYGAGEAETASPTSNGGTAYSGSETLIHSTRTFRKSFAHRWNIVLSKTRDSIYGFIGHLGSLFMWILSVFLAVLRTIYLLLFLRLPLHYACQARSVIVCANKCEPEYTRWVDAFNRFEQLHGGESLPEDRDAVELQTMTTVAELDPAVAVVGQSSTPPQRPAMPLSVEIFRDNWVKYLDSRRVEWNVYLTVSGFGFTVAPSIFQIPEVSQDPVIRTLTSMAISNAIISVLYCTFFFFHFRSSHVQDVRYAHLWIKEARNSRNMVIWSPWVIISLPAAATAWTGICYVLAIFCYVWRTGGDEDAEMSQPVAMKRVFGLRTMITGLFAVGLVYMVLSLRTLRKYEASIIGRRDSVPHSPGAVTDNVDGNSIET